MSSHANGRRQNYIRECLLRLEEMQLQIAASDILSYQCHKILSWGRHGAKPLKYIRVQNDNRFGGTGLPHKRYGQYKDPRVNTELLDDRILSKRALRKH
jgi:hypothetical protein